MLIRDATPDDVEFIFERAIKFNALHYDVPLDYNRLANYVESLICQPNGVMLVSDTGILAGILVDDPIRDWLALVETAWFDTGRSGIRLLDEFENRAREFGADEVRMTTLTVNPWVSKLLKRRGYHEIETSHRLLI